ncbi:unnamed protein product, partial [Mesorhabditis spiculigera]
MKCYYYRKTNSLPKFRVGGTVSIYRSQLCLRPKFFKPFFVDLVSIGYIESQENLLDLRGCQFRLMISLGEFCEEVRDWLRVIVLRARVPHTLLGRPLDWQVEEPRQMDMSAVSPLSCFKLWTKNRAQKPAIEY